MGARAMLVRCEWIAELAARLLGLRVYTLEELRKSYGRVMSTEDSVSYVSKTGAPPRAKVASHGRITEDLCHSLELRTT